jgi:hypothetical protein
MVQASQGRAGKIPEESPEKYADLVVGKPLLPLLGYIVPLVGNFFDHQPLPWDTAGLRRGNDRMGIGQ